MTDIAKKSLQLIKHVFEEGNHFPECVNGHGTNRFNERVGDRFFFGPGFDQVDLPGIKKNNAEDGYVNRQI